MEYCLLSSLSVAVDWCSLLLMLIYEWLVVCVKVFGGRVCVWVVFFFFFFLCGFFLFFFFFIYIYIYICLCVVDMYWFCWVEGCFDR